MECENDPKEKGQSVSRRSRKKRKKLNALYAMMLTHLVGRPALIGLIVTNVKYGRIQNAPRKILPGGIYISHLCFVDYVDSINV